MKSVSTGIQMNWKKINLYILISCTISWSVALVMALAHISITSITGTIFLAVFYMPAPALATFFIQKFMYRENFKPYGWTFDTKAIAWILLTPLLFLTLTLLTFGVIALLGNTHIISHFGQLDFTQEHFNQSLRELAQDKIDLGSIEFPTIPPVLAFFAMLLQAVIAGSTISLPIMFGEEFGWRGLMLSETKQLGFLKSNLLIGMVWGLWHFPVILMGHNYPHHPYAGILMMCLFTISISPLFAYVRTKTKSILGPCMFHGMLNATGTLYLLFVANGNELYSFVAGWAGVIASLVLTSCIFVFDKEFVSAYTSSG